MIWLTIILVLSLLLNCVMGWFIFKLLKRLVIIQESFQIFDNQMAEFEQHLKEVYELEMFYGDQTLEALIKHTKFITEAYSDLKQEYAVVSGETDATPEEELEPKQFQFTTSRK